MSVVLCKFPSVANERPCREEKKATEVLRSEGEVMNLRGVIHTEKEGVGTRTFPATLCTNFMKDCTLYYIKKKF